MSVTKKSAAAKEREQERKIRDYAMHLLNFMCACRDESYYKGLRLKRSQLPEYCERWDGFVRGCSYAGGSKWYDYLNALYKDYEALHGSLFSISRGESERGNDDLL